MVHENDLKMLRDRIKELEENLKVVYRKLELAYPESSDPINSARVQEALRRGDKIEAIKLYRELTGAGLAEAKDAIDNA
ncbi:MAG: ribosomal protein L7/L12 [Anaerolineales bacterium]